MIDKEKLLAPRADTEHGMPESDVEIPGVGTVRVRGLRRGEVLAAQKIDDVSLFERRMVHLGLVDPQMSEVEVGRWQESSPAGEMEPVIDRIRELSAIRPSADKESYKSVRGEPGS